MAGFVWKAQTSEPWKVSSTSWMSLWFLQRHATKRGRNASSDSYHMMSVICFCTSKIFQILYGSILFYNVLYGCCEFLTAKVWLKPHGMVFDDSQGKWQEEQGVARLEMERLPGLRQQSSEHWNRNQTHLALHLQSPTDKVTENLKSLCSKQKMEKEIEKKQPEDKLEQKK